MVTSTDLHTHCFTLHLAIVGDAGGSSINVLLLNTLVMGWGSDCSFFGDGLLIFHFAEVFYKTGQAVKPQGNNRV